VAIKILLLTAVLPATVFAALLVALAPPWRGRGLPARWAWVAGVAMAACFALACPLVFGSWDLWPVRAHQRLPHAGLIAGLACAILGLAPRLHGAARAAIVLAAGSAGIGLIVHPVLSNSISGAVLWLAIAGLGTAGAGLWWVSEQLAQRSPGWAAPGAAALASLGASVVLVASSSAALAQTAGVLCALAVASLVLTLWNRSMSIAGGAAGIAGLVLASILATGHLFNGGRTPTLSTLLVAAALPAGLLAHHLLGSRRATRNGLLSLATVAALAGGAAAWAIFVAVNAEPAF
jgi:hypothetical protein